MDKEVTDHTFERLTADLEKWAQVQDPNSEGRAMYQGMLVELACFAEHPRNFRGQMTSLSAWLFNEDFAQSFPVKVSFVPMMHPGETERICRKVGAHRKEAKGKEDRTPAQREYDRAYNRLKTRKQRGKISTDEWDAAVTEAQDLVVRSERGELTDEEWKRRLAEL